MHATCAAIDDARGIALRHVPGREKEGLSGWHLSNFMEPSAIIDKLGAYSHFGDERDAALVAGGETAVRAAVNLGGDLFQSRSSLPFAGRYPRDAFDVFPDANEGSATGGGA